VDFNRRGAIGPLLSAHWISVPQPGSGTSCLALWVAVNSPGGTITGPVL
jgi:hypothetical protein